MALSGTDTEKLKELTTFTYKNQAIWFLNAYWETLSAEGEIIWKWVHKCEEFDLQKGKEGNELDELNAHRFLEFFNETQTVREMRDSLRSTGAIGAGPVKMVPLIHFLVFRFKVNFHELVNASQGDNKAEIEEAQRMLEAVQAAFRESEEKAREAAAALARAKQREAEAAAAVENAKKQEQEAYDRAAESAAAQKELEAALAELKAQEDAYNNKKLDLERKSQEGGVVSRNKAANELAQHLAEDPLPLRRAKITQEAAVKKAERARLEAEAAAERSSQARAASEEARAAAERAAAESEAAKNAAEAAVEEAANRVGEAEEYLKKVKSKPGQAQGAIWWLERELYEQRKYLPASRGGIAK